MAQQPSEVRYPLPLGGDLAHEAANLLEVRLVGPGQLPGVPRPHLVQYRRPVRVVFLQVSVQVGLLSETPLAERALERFFLVVDVPHVALQVAGDAEAPLAVFTLVGLLAGVRPQVPRQVGGSGEHLAAEFARVSVLGLETGLDADGVRWKAGGLLLLLLLLLRLLLTRVALRLLWLAGSWAGYPWDWLRRGGRRGGRGGGESVGRQGNHGWQGSDLDLGQIWDR